MDIEVRLLRSFVTVFEKGSLSRAADKLGCTQAAMSMRLKMLETEIGEPLFQRQHHKLQPTFKGTEFYARALSVLAVYDEMISATRSPVSREKIRIGVPDDYALGILPRVFARLPVENGKLEVEIICDLSANLVASLQRQEIDLAVVTLAARPAAALFSVDVALSWVAHPDLVVEPGRPVDLAAYPEGCVFRRAMISALGAAARPRQVLAQSKNHAGIIAAVRGQMAITAMAQGTAPNGLAEIAETGWLPSLGKIPIYLLSSGASLSKPVMQIEAAIEAELATLGVTAPVGSS